MEYNENNEVVPEIEDNAENENDSIYYSVASVMERIIQ